MVEGKEQGVCSMTIEQLAKIALDIYRAGVKTKTAEESWIDSTAAIVREVLGPVTEEEVGEAWRIFQKPGDGRDSMNRALVESLAHRLSQLTQVKELSPVPTTNKENAPELAKPDDAEVERVAKAIENANEPGNWDALPLYGLEHRLKQARAAISAMRGEKRWGGVGYVAGQF